MAFVQRDIDIAVTLGTGAFGEGGEDTINLAGYRVSASIDILGMPSLNSAQIRVYGMKLSLMNRLAQVGFFQPAIRRNDVSLKAGDAKSGMSLVFSGGVSKAWADFQSAPDVSFNFMALTGMLQKVKPVAAVSYTGPTDVAVVMGSLATVMGCTLENNGVSVILANPYFPGTALDQMHAAAIAANIYAYIADDGKTLVILPKNGHRRSTTPPEISAATGLAGYPAYVGPGQISFRTLYNPAIRFMGLVNVVSINKPASGSWKVIKMTHNLDSQTPNGAWFTDILATNLAERQN
jgi:hypothetical protein